MRSPHFINQYSDSLIDLLTAQCADLEKLLHLARLEKDAIENTDFQEVFRIVTERDNLNQRLEVFQRQIYELRSQLNENSLESFYQNPVTVRTTKLIGEILNQDRQSQQMLQTFRQTAVQNLSQLNVSRKSLKNYSEHQSKGLAYNQKV